MAFSCPTAVEAQDIAKAAESFQQAQSAELRGDHSFAAELYEVAHRAAPSPEALRSAMRTRKAAGQPALAATHALRVLEQYGDDEESRKRAEAVLGELEPSLLRVTVHCPDAPCTLALDGGALGLPADSRQQFFVEPGSHEISATVGETAAPTQSFEGRAGEQRELTFEQPDPQPASPSAPATEDSVSSEGRAESSPAELSSPAEPAAPAASSDSEQAGLHPAVFYTGLLVTVGLGATTSWAALDTEKQADDYRDAPTRERYDSGKARQRQTNALLGATAAAGVATMLIGIVWTDWSGEPSSERAPPQAAVRVGASGRDGMMFVEGSF